MDFIKTILEKLKINEIFGILFISSLAITLMPNKVLIQLDILNFRIAYQQYLSAIIILVGAYYLYNIILKLYHCIRKIIYAPERLITNYLKNSMSEDEFNFLVEKFYNPYEKRFMLTAKIDYSDGRITPLETNMIIYRASNLSSLGMLFDYNLHNYALHLLNEDIQKGIIRIDNKAVMANKKQRLCFNL